MRKKRRDIVARRARISIFILRPEVISGVEVIKLTHKLNLSFHNPSSRKQPLFCDGSVLKGWIDIPENLKEVSSTINPEHIYSFRELEINGKPAPYRKDIQYANSNQVEFQILCNKIAVPKETYDVSYIEEGLYETNDFYEDEIRTTLPNMFIIVEKPPDLQVSINPFGENASARVFENSSRLTLIDIRGELTSGNGFSFKWRKSGTSQSAHQDAGTSQSADQNTRMLKKIYDTVEKVEKGQKTIMEAVGEVKKEVMEAQELSKDILTIVQQYPEYVESLLTEQLGELRQIFLKTAKELKDKDPQTAKEAKKWHDYLQKGISVTADVVQIVVFLTGIASLPALANSDTAQRVNEFLSRIARALQQRL